jgi:hypothetical protein
MKRSALVIIAIVAAFTMQAQVYGLWEVVEVIVGEETMTPVARWFQLNADNTTQSGNGGLEHSSGTYIITPDNSVLFFTDQYGKPDEFGAFNVLLAGNKMTWNRVEEGQPVEVSLEKVTKKPVGPWDEAIGNWKLVESTEHDEISDQQIFMRWDREYRSRNGLLGENTRGVWHIAGHHPHLKLMSFNPDQPDQNYVISFFNDYRMIWTGEDESIRLVFDRVLQ